MAFETIPLSSYIDDGDPGDEDEIEATVDSPVIVDHSGDATFKLRVNWPANLSSVRVAIIFPSMASVTGGSVSPEPTGTTKNEQSDRVTFDVPSCTKGTTYTFTVSADASQSGTGDVTYKLDTAEYNTTIQRTRSIEYQEEQGS